MKQCILCPTWAPRNAGSAGVLSFSNVGNEWISLLQNMFLKIFSATSEINVRPFYFWISGPMLWHTQHYYTQRWQSITEWKLWSRMPSKCDNGFSAQHVGQEVHDQLECGLFLMLQTCACFNVAEYVLLQSGKNILCNLKNQCEASDLLVCSAVVYPVPLQPTPAIKDGMAVLKPCPVQMRQCILCPARGQDMHDWLERGLFYFTN